MKITTLSSKLALLSIIFLSTPVWATEWKGLEPLKSRRADVERTLGSPVEGKSIDSGSLRFKAPEGLVTVSFVTERFLQSKKLPKSLEGTVLQIVIQHEKSNATPETLLLAENRNFRKEENKGGVIYRNAKEGVIHTFVDGKLRTTYYTPSEQQWSKNQGTRVLNLF
jgi:hypothetical protein